MPITDLTADVNSKKFLSGRENFKIELLVLHDTAGTIAKPDLNDQTREVLEAREKFYTEDWFATNLVPGLRAYLNRPAAR